MYALLNHADGSAGQYTPPPCSFNRVTMNLTITTNGVQFDRLGIMYLGDIEVFRTSTAEPGGEEIAWTYVKEMDHYYSLWKDPQKIIFDIGNLIDEKYTGAFNTTLTATFFTVPGSGPYADIILPISSRSSDAGKGSAFQLPGEPASVNHTLPRNLQRAVVSISANGQGTGEEFWYTNTLDELTGTFEATIGQLNGKTSDRRVLLYIDDAFAGMVLPFPVIFTGGIVPGLWRRIVGLQAFDLKEHEIDITPFLPLLCDGKPHRFDIRVNGWDGGLFEKVKPSISNPFWVATGKIFLYLDEAGSATTGTGPVSYTNGGRTFFSSWFSTDRSTMLNDTLSWQIHDGPGTVLEHKARIKLSSGFWDVEWSQKLHVDITNDMIQEGYLQRTVLNHTGEDQAIRKPANGTNGTGTVDFHTKYAHRLNLTTSYQQRTDETFDIQAKIEDFLFNSAVTGPSVFPTGLEIEDQLTSEYDVPSTVMQRRLVLDQDSPMFDMTTAQHATNLSGTATYVSAKNYSYSYGNTSQDYVFLGAKALDQPGTEIYSRTVEAQRLTLVKDEERLAGKHMQINSQANLGGVESAEEHLATMSIREILGRGPGLDPDGQLVQASIKQGPSMLEASNADKVFRAQGVPI